MRIAAPQFDAELLARHDRPGPRYTSYPAAPRFSEAFGEAALREAIAASNEMPIPRPLSLYVHVPFCSSPCFYCGCNRVITRDATRGQRYVARLRREIDAVAPLFSPDREVVQLHVGGGTPNFLAPEALAAIVGHLRARFPFRRGAGLDLSIEVDPRVADPAALATLAEAGFNRISLGVQDFDAPVQEAVNRRQGVAETAALVEAARRAGLRSVNVDLIYGLPRQTLEGFAATLDAVIAMRPDRLAVYAYAHMPALFRAQRRIDPAELPSPSTKIALLGLAIERLTAAGYVYIGMDHFALPLDELAVAQREGGLHRNFMGYTTHADTDLVGFGASAISRIGSAYAQNERDLAAWAEAIDAGRLPVMRGLALDDDDLLRGEVIQSLMCQGEVDLWRVGERHGVDARPLLDDAGPRLAPLAADGLVERQGSRLRVTPRGRLLVRVVAGCFDRYAAPTPA
ncbi:MAG TPA: oxygen-independent coproporphyrinogen III oxidase [Xanthomonadaceae bacterium]|nr:oxygen-independent coproporphyrinogen III oxidase [Xanthomonadaceae bacterium]